VQTIVIDPPYGIRYRSNFQPNIGDLNVKDGDDASLTREPEMIQAYRDTWELGIHSYLSYLRDRLQVSRELLTDSGSVFVQIGEENVHRVRIILDEVFGAEHFVSQITFATTSGAGSPGELNNLPATCNYLLWYAKDREQMKYHQLYAGKRGVGEDSNYSWIQAVKADLFPGFQFGAGARTGMWSRWRRLGCRGPGGPAQPRRQPRRRSGGPAAHRTPHAIRGRWRCGSPATTVASAGCDLSKP